MNLTAISSFIKLWIYVDVDHHQEAQISLWIIQIMY